MTEHRYILEPYKGLKSRFTCPECKKKGMFTKYIDTETGQYISDEVGRCNRESKCEYHYTPKQYFDAHNIKPEQITSYTKKMSIESPKKQASFIPFDTLKQSLTAYESNYFVSYLISLFGEKAATNLIERYYIGTSKHWPGSVVFWQLDETMKVHTGKIMLYDKQSGKRVKEPFNHVAWVHTLTNKPDFVLNQCLFGQHLLKDVTKPVAIVESEKTAIIASSFFTDVIWLACGGLNGLNAEKCQCLKNRIVTLWPDLKCLDKWEQKADELSKVLKTEIKVSNFLESHTSEVERTEGYDLADYLTMPEFIHEAQSATDEANRNVAAYFRDYESVCRRDWVAMPEMPELYYKEFCTCFKPLSFDEFCTEAQKLLKISFN
jgi:tellurite resistance-related uncharacterized protein